MGPLSTCGRRARLYAELEVNLAKPAQSLRAQGISKAEQTGYSGPLTRHGKSFGHVARVTPQSHAAESRHHILAWILGIRVGWRQ
jgi:hypothetical protein